MNNKTDLIDQLRIDRPQFDDQPRTRWWLWILILIIFLIAGFFGWQWWQLQQRPVVVPIQAEQVTVKAAGQQISVLDASGYVVARRQATVSSEVTGKLAEVLVEEGMEVAAGQVLARVDATTELAQLALAQAQLNSAGSVLKEIEVQLNDAKRSLNRQRQLMEKGLTSQSLLDEASASVASLEARLLARTDDVAVSRKSLELRQQLLDELTIRAPFDGVVIAKAAQPGEMVSPISAGGGFTRTGICTIVDMQSLEIEVDVNEAYIQRVRSKHAATAILDAYPDWQIPAEVIAIVPTADRQKATVRVRVGFLQTDRRILPDMGVKVRFLDDQQQRTQSPDEEIQSLKIPASAIYRDKGTDYVFIIVDEQVEKRAVRVSERRSDGVIIASGISGFEKLVSQIPAPGLLDGQVVRY